MMILVCGGRDYQDFWKLDDVLSNYVSIYKDIIVQGGASGADALAKEWARDWGMPVVQVDANWTAFGKGAGPIRNEWMMRLKPDRVIAFPGGTGTANMIKLAKEAGVEVIEVE